MSRIGAPYDQDSARQFLDLHPPYGGLPRPLRPVLPDPMREGGWARYHGHDLHQLSDDELAHEDRQLFVRVAFWSFDQVPPWVWERRGKLRAERRRRQREGRSRPAPRRPWRDIPLEDLE